MMTWIKCTDRMPPEEMWVLITLNGKVPRSPAYWAGDCWYLDNDYFPYTDVVTHWMPYPEPAKENWHGVD